MNRQHGFSAYIIGNIKETGSNISYDSRKCRSGHSPAKTKDHNRIQNDIHNGSQQVSDHGFPGCSLSAQNIRKRSRKHDRWRADGNDRQILSCKAYGILTGADQMKDLFHAKHGNHGYHDTKSQ